MVDLSKTLNQLDGTWTEQPGYPTSLAAKCHALRRKPLRDFLIEDLRIMIGQNISLKLLIPLALDQLESNPLAEGDFYPGDLLCALLSAETEFWRTHADLRGRATHTYHRALRLVEEAQEDIVVRKALDEAHQKFQRSAK